MTDTAEQRVIAGLNGLFGLELATIDEARAWISGDEGRRHLIKDGDSRAIEHANAVLAHNTRTIDTPMAQRAKGVNEADAIVARLREIVTNPGLLAGEHGQPVPDEAARAQAIEGLEAAEQNRAAWDA
jgi:hypothetical protein